MPPAGKEKPMSIDHSTITKLDTEARRLILRGVNAIYEPVRRTLGPSGSNALLYRTYNRGPRITNDGVTIAEVIEPANESERLVAGAFKEAAKRTNELAGDGTTTTVVLSGKLIHELFSRFTPGSIRSKTSGGALGIMELRKTMLEEKDTIVQTIKDNAVPIASVEDLKKIATVSVEDPLLGETISNLMWEIGVNGFVNVIEGHKRIIETEIIKGMRFPARVAAKFFINNPARYEMVAEDVPVLVTDHPLDNPMSIGAFTRNLKATKLAILAPSFSDDVLLHMAEAWKQKFFVYPIATPSLRTEDFEDVAIYMGAKFINKALGMKVENTKEEDLGYIEKIVVKSADLIEDAIALGGWGTKNEALQIPGGELEIVESSPIQTRINILKEQMEETRVDSHKKLLERRIASMSSAVGIIRVGAPSQAESLYKKLKIEDAVYACKSALEEGYVRGGGLCLKDIGEALPEDSLLKSILSAPYDQIQENNEGPLEIGADVIDPAKVVRLALEHAVSVAAHLATVKILIPEKKDIQPGEGYGLIADALMMHAKFLARKEGLIKDADLLVEQERLQNYENILLNDRD